MFLRHPSLGDAPCLWLVIRVSQDLTDDYDRDRHIEIARGSKGIRPPTGRVTCFKALPNQTIGGLRLVLEH